MMPQRRPPDDPGEWLNRARSNLKRAREDVRLEGVYLEDLCFDAQQAAESKAANGPVGNGVSGGAEERNRSVEPAALEVRRQVEYGSAHVKASLLQEGA